MCFVLFFTASTAVWCVCRTLIAHVVCCFAVVVVVVQSFALRFVSVSGRVVWYNSRVMCIYLDSDIDTGHCTPETCFAVQPGDNDNVDP